MHSAKFAISHGGKNDITPHIKTAKHERNDKDKASACRNSHRIIDFLSKEGTTVINVEVLFTGFLVEHSVPVAVFDHCGPKLV